MRRSGAVRAGETRMRRVLPSLFAALDAMRAIDLSGASGFGGWRADGSTTHPTWRAWLLAYSAFRKRWDQVAAKARRTLEFAQA